MDAASVEINDGVFCAEHLQEVCEDCSADFREENDAFYGFDTTDRDAIICPPASPNSDGVYECKKHHSQSCSQCFSWKKQIVKARHAAKAEGR